MSSRTHEPKVKLSNQTRGKVGPWLPTPYLVNTYKGILLQKFRRRVRMHADSMSWNIYEYEWQKIPKEVSKYDE